MMNSKKRNKTKVNLHKIQIYIEDQCHLYHQVKKTQMNQTNQVLKKRLLITNHKKLLLDLAPQNQIQAKKLKFKSSLKKSQLIKIL